MKESLAVAEGCLEKAQPEVDAGVTVLPSLSWFSLSLRPAEALLGSLLLLSPGSASLWCLQSHQDGSKLSS